MGQRLHLLAQVAALRLILLQPLRFELAFQGPWYRPDPRRLFKAWLDAYWHIAAYIVASIGWPEGAGQMLDDVKRVEAEWKSRMDEMAPEWPDRWSLRRALKRLSQGCGHGG
jgi:hypothetical protein